MEHIETFDEIYLHNEHIETLKKLTKTVEKLKIELANLKNDYEAHGHCELMKTHCDCKPSY
jgi:hypothetical protein